MNDNNVIKGGDERVLLKHTNRRNYRIANLSLRSGISCYCCSYCLQYCWVSRRSNYRTTIPPRRTSVWGYRRTDISSSIECLLSWLSLKEDSFAPPVSLFTSFFSPHPLPTLLKIRAKNSCLPLSDRYKTLDSFQTLFHFQTSILLVISTVTLLSSWYLHSFVSSPFPSFV